MSSIRDVWRTYAGAELFNGITRMSLIDGDGYHILFSRRKDLTEKVINLILNEGYHPEDMTPRVRD